MRVAVVGLGDVGDGGKVSCLASQGDEALAGYLVATEVVEDPERRRVSGEALGLRRSSRVVWRHKAILGVAVLVGILAGAAFGVLNPPMLTSKTLVLLPPTVKSLARADRTTSDPAGHRGE